MTPEGKVKKIVSTYLRQVPGLWYTMPVPSGYGESTLDYIGCFNGQFFAIETKKPGGKPTPRQLQTIAAIERNGGKCFVIDGDLTELKNWTSTT